MKRSKSNIFFLSCSIYILFIMCFIINNNNLLEGLYGRRRSVQLVSLTITSEISDGVLRLLRSAGLYGVNLKVLGLDEWNNVQNGERFHFTKVLLLRKEMEKHKDKQNLIVMFIDAYDTIFTAGEDEIIHKFLELDANIVFGAETNCWPNKTLKYIFPKEESGYKCLNSGLLIGYAPQIYNLLQHKIKESENLRRDQIYYYSLFMDPEIREALKIKLDHKASLILNLHVLPRDHYKFVYEENDTYIENVKYNTRPVLIHGNGKGKQDGNWIGNYVARSYTKAEGCTTCRDGRIELSKKKELEYPKVLLGIFVEEKTPLLDEMLSKVFHLDYPKKRIFLFVHNRIKEHETQIQKWMSIVKDDYLDSSFQMRSKMSEGKVKSLAVETCLKISCDVFFNVDSDAILDNPDTLFLLISYNRTILAPVISRVHSDYSTIWGTIALHKNYTNTSDYKDILSGKTRGIWNVPYVGVVFVIWKSIIKSGKLEFPSHRSSVNGYVAFSNHMKKNGIFMHAVNLEKYGYLTNVTDISLGKLPYLNPDYRDTIKYMYPQL